MFDFDFLKEIKVGKTEKTEINKHVVDNFDWFIFKKGEGNFVVVPVWTLTSTRSTRENEKLRMRRIRGSTPTNVFGLNYWSIPSYDYANVENVPGFPLSMCNKAQKAEFNGYLQDFDFVKPFTELGYKACGICRGMIMEDKHPIVDDVLKKEKLNEEMSVEEAAWIMADEYSKKIKEQYLEFAEKSRIRNREIRLNTFGLPY